MMVAVLLRTGYGKVGSYNFDWMNILKFDHINLDLSLMSYADIFKELKVSVFYILP